MSKPAIAIDIDDVLGNETEALRIFVNEYKGLNLGPDAYRVGGDGDYKGYWASVWGTDRETASAIYESYIDSGAKYTHAPVNGAVGALQILKKRYKLIVVTARGDRHVEQTHAWLRRHYPETFSHVEFMPLWGDTASKAQIALHHKAAYLIDDSYEHCAIAAEAGLKALLFGEYGWRRETALGQGIHRVKDWAAVLEYFDGRD